MQQDFVAWGVECFGPGPVTDRNERNHRFLEEALELVQACGMSREAAAEMVRHVYEEKQPGEVGQEIGGVCNALSLLAHAHSRDLTIVWQRELERCWRQIDRIRAKRATKPALTP